jgi:hypothetical protein
MKNSATVHAHFLHEPSIVSVEETNMTQESGRYILIVLKTEFQIALKRIESFCKTDFFTIYDTQDRQDEYSVTNKSLPHLVNSPSAGERLRKTATVSFSFSMLLKPVVEPPSQSAPGPRKLLLV